MRIDLVTKVSLVVIAMCLAALTIKSFLPGPAVARGEEIVKVDVVRVGGRAIWRAVDVNVREVGGSPISKGELLGKE